MRVHLIIIMKINIFTDGSCKGNPGPGGWCTIIMEESQEKPVKILHGGARDTTNNRMEMIAVIEALKYLEENKLSNSEISLYSDSNLVISTLNLNWKKKANLDLWETLLGLNKKFNVKYVWVKGHASNYWNNECDKIAQKEADNQ